MSAEILLERNGRGENTPLEKGSLPEDGVRVASGWGNQGGEERRPGFS